MTRHGDPALDEDAAKLEALDADAGCSLDDLDPWPGEECGRWSNGRLTRYCSKAGSEECEFECPNG